MSEKYKIVKVELPINLNDFVNGVESNPNPDPRWPSIN